MKNAKESCSFCNSSIRRSQQTRADSDIVASATTWSPYLILVAFLLETVTDT